MFSTISKLKNFRDILRETGGNLAETFDTIANTIRERFKLESKIAAMTAQGMTSAAIMLCMPWGIGGMMYFLDPVMSKPLFTTGLGFVILGVVCILEIIGYFVIMKIIKFRV
jgi:tight adherence protein B